MRVSSITHLTPFETINLTRISYLALPFTLESHFAEIVKSRAYRAVYCTVQVSSLMARDFLSPPPHDWIGLSSFNRFCFWRCLWVCCAALLLFFFFFPLSLFPMSPSAGEPADEAVLWGKKQRRYTAAATADFNRYSFARLSPSTAAVAAAASQCSRSSSQFSPSFS